MNNIFMTGLCFVASKLMQAAGSGVAEDLTKMKMAIVYLHVVKISRLLWISIVGAGACLIFLLVGIVLIPHAILDYAQWDVSMKVGISLICAVCYILIAAGIFAFVFAEDKWMKMLNVGENQKDLTK